MDVLQGFPSASTPGHGKAVLLLSSRGNPDEVQMVALLMFGGSLAFGRIGFLF